MNPGLGAPEVEPPIDLDRIKFYPQFTIDLFDVECQSGRDNKK